MRIPAKEAGKCLDRFSGIARKIIGRRDIARRRGRPNCSREAVKREQELGLTEIMVLSGLGAGT